MAARRGASSLEAGPETDWGPGEVRVRKTEASRTRPVVPVWLGCLGWGAGGLRKRRSMMGWSGQGVLRVLEPRASLCRGLGSRVPQVTQ